MFMNKLKTFSPTILRIGIALVFIWFGIDQIIDPTSYVGFLPDWLISISHMAPKTIVLLNGTFEIIFGTALAFGLFTRFVAFLLFLHMADITFTVGYDAIGVRDFGLTIASLAVWLNGFDFLTLDNWMSIPPVPQNENHN